MTKQTKHTHAFWSRGVILLLGLLLLVQVGGIVRALQLPAEFANQLSLPQWMLIATAFFWSGAFGWALFECVRGKRHAVNRALWVVCGFMVYSALRLVIFAESDYDRQRLPFLVVITLIVVMIFAVIGTIAHRKTNE